MYLTRRLLLIVVLGLIAIGATWTLTQEEVFDNRVRVGEHSPDMVAEQILIVRMNEEGNPRFKLSAPKIEHYQHNGSSHIMSPHVELYNPAQNAWQIDADHGYATSDFKKIILTGNVSFYQAAGPNNKDSHMKMEKLIIYPKKRYAETDSEVTLSQPGSVLRGTGMTADLIKNRVKLLSHVTGSYELSQDEKKP